MINVRSEDTLKKTRKAALQPESSESSAAIPILSEIEERVKCRWCSRKFMPSRIETHEDICRNNSLNSNTKRTKML
jgi:hypothetical protein